MLKLNVKVNILIEFQIIRIIIHLWEILEIQLHIWQENKQIYTSDISNYFKKGIHKSRITISKLLFSFLTIFTRKSGQHKEFVRTLSSYGPNKGSEGCLNVRTMMDWWKTWDYGLDTILEVWQGQWRPHSEGCWSCYD